MIRIRPFKKPDPALEKKPDPDEDDPNPTLEKKKRTLDPKPDQRFL